MLTLTLTKTNDISETDLIPGSKWRRKSDGAECVLMEDDLDGLDWFLVCGFKAVRVCGACNRTCREMLAWLLRDFECVGERRRDIKRLIDIDQSHLFAHEKQVWRLTGRRSSIGHSEAVRIDGPTTARTIDPYQQVRDLGPIHIDPSVTGGGE